MARKKNNNGKHPRGWYCFSRDLLSSQRYRRCSWTTKGVYFDLLNVLSLQRHPGALCLKDYDLKPNNERSLTSRCLQCQKKAKEGEYQSLKYFAEAISVSVSGPRPTLLHGLQELYLRGIIIIEGDTLIQKRMYRDNGFDLSDDMATLNGADVMVVAGSPDDAAPDPDAENLRLSEGAKGALSSDKQKINVSSCARVGGGDAPAQSKESESKSNNNKDIKRGVGKSKEKENKNTNGNPKKAKFVPPTLDEVTAYCKEKGYTFDPEMFFAHYEANGWVQGRDGKSIKSWRACCVTWQKRENNGEFRGKSSGGAPKIKPNAAVPLTENNTDKYKGGW